MKPDNRISWIEMAYLIIAMLAIGTASIYVTHITVLTLIGVSNAVQFFYARKKRGNRK